MSSVGIPSDPDCKQQKIKKKKEPDDMSFLRESKWEYVTWGSSGLSLGIFAAIGGELHFKDPTKHEVRFSYKAVGLSTPLPGGKLPKLFKGVEGSHAPIDFRSDATKLYMMPRFEGIELTTDDICGPCLIFDAGMTIGKGHSGSLMFLGGAAAAPDPFSFSPDIAKAVIFLVCDNEGWSMGASGCLGHLGLADDSPSIRFEGIWKVEIDGQIFYYNFKPGSMLVEWANDPNFVVVKGKGWRSVMSEAAMSINWWESGGGYEIWDKPRSEPWDRATGFWYPNPRRRDRRHPIIAEQLGVCI